MAKTELTVVIPTFNEGDIIESSLKHISRALGEMCSKTEIIITDDGKDDLPEVIKKIHKLFNFSNIYVIRNKVHLGKGESIKQAFKVSQGNVVGFIDVDLSVDPIYIHDAIIEIKNGNDICIASRIGNRFKTDKSLVTSIIATTFSLINKIFLFNKRKTFKDTQCGFKFFKKEIANHLYKDLVAPDGLTDLEILVKAVGLDYKISELGVPRYNDRVGKRKLSRIIVGETLSLCRIFYKYKIKKITSN